MIMPPKRLIVIGLIILLSASAIAAVSAADFSPLVGRWQRTDGGYILEFHSIDVDGKIKAGYLNPNPINVASARASMYKQHMKVDVELRDVGYPGSTYTLLYAPQKDALYGYYYQAVAGQTFEVLFVRMK